MPKNKLIILVILYFAFISLGLPDQSLGVAWPYMRKTLELPLAYAGFILMFTSLLGAVSGFASGYFMQKYKISTILIVSCLLTAFGIFGYSFAASWLMIVLMTIPQGLGAGTIDASLNNYVAENYSSKHMNWLHGFWGVGATLGPAIMTLAVANQQNWRLGYLVIASIQIVLTIVFFTTAKKWKNMTVKSEVVVEKSSEYKLLSFAPIAAMLIFFFYTTIEASVGVWFYSVMFEGKNIRAEQAGLLIVLYWSFLTFGRFLIGMISNKIGNRKIIYYGLSGALVSAFFLISDNPYILLCALCCLGFSLAGIYPSFMHETPKRFGSNFGKKMTGYQAGAACLGVAVMMPVVGGVLSLIGLVYLPYLLVFGTVLVMFLTFRLYK